MLVDPALSSAWYFDRPGKRPAPSVVRGDDPCALPRACKNAVEIEGTRQAHARDGAALTRFLHWLATEAPDRPCRTRSTVVDASWRASARRPAR